jgi:hypothetical protein
MLIVYIVLVFCTLLRWGILPFIAYAPWDIRLPSKPAASLAGLFASHNCSGPNELQARLHLPPGLHLDAAAHTTCHYPRYCTWQSSLNATFLNASFLSLQGFSASNCSGNVTYSAGLALALPSTSGGLEGCLAHASGSALFLPNYNDPEATPPWTGIYRYPNIILLRILFILLLRPFSLLFLLLLLLAARSRRVELADSFKVELEPWELERSASASPLYLAAALALFGASQTLFAADYFKGEAYANICRLRTLDSPYSWYPLSCSVELAALLALTLHLQLARLVRNGFCFGGCVVYVWVVHALLSRLAQGQTLMPRERPYRLPCTVSASAATLAVTLCCVISAATTLASVLAQPAGVLHPTSRALALAAPRARG